MRGSELTFLASVAGGGVGSLLLRLHRDAARRLQTALAPKSKGPLNSALKAFARFSAACPARELFKEPRWYGDGAVSS